MSLMSVCLFDRALLQKRHESVCHAGHYSLWKKYVSNERMSLTHTRFFKHKRAHTISQTQSHHTHTHASFAYTTRTPLQTHTHSHTHMYLSHTCSWVSYYTLSHAYELSPTHTHTHTVSQTLSHHTHTHTSFAYTAHTLAHTHTHTHKYTYLSHMCSWVT